MTRICATENCHRATDWPANPETKARYCADCTSALWKTGTMPVLPRWLARVADPVGEGATSGIERDFTRKSAA
jgi:hypothetical protein